VRCEGRCKSHHSDETGQQTREIWQLQTPLLVPRSTEISIRSVTQSQRHDPLLAEVADSFPPVINQFSVTTGSTNGGRCLAPTMSGTVAFLRRSRARTAARTDNGLLFSLSCESGRTLRHRYWNTDATKGPMQHSRETKQQQAGPVLGPRKTCWAKGNRDPAEH
jgi:hypothetical protein